MDARLRINITLDAERSVKLRRLAERTRVPQDRLASSLLATALDEAESDAETITARLDAIPGAFERARLGLKRGRGGAVVRLEEL